MALHGRFSQSSWNFRWVRRSFSSTAIAFTLLSIFFSVSSTYAAPPGPSSTEEPQAPIPSQQRKGTPPADPVRFFSVQREETLAREAIESVLQKTLSAYGPRYRIGPVSVRVDGSWARGEADWIGKLQAIPGPLTILARRMDNSSWQALMPSTDGAFLQWLHAMPVSLLSTSEITRIELQARNLDASRSPSFLPNLTPPEFSGNGSSGEPDFQQPTPVPQTINPIKLIPGTVDLEPEIESALISALISGQQVLPVVDVFAPTDVQVMGDWQFISVIGLVGVGDDLSWTLTENGSWFGLALLHVEDSGYWFGAIEGTPEYSALMARIPDSSMNSFMKMEMDPRQRIHMLGSSSYIFPWQSGTSMQYGNRGVHNNEFIVVPGWKAVDLLSDGNTGAGHAPNRLLAAASGAVTYKCNPSNGGVTSAIRIGDLMYTHLVNSSNFYVGKSYSQGEEIGQLKTGSFDENCGYASQTSPWFHVHLGFPNTGSVTFENWTLTFSDQLWRNGSDTRGTGGWLPAGSGGNNCNNPSPNSDQIGIYSDANYCGSYKILGIGNYANPGAMGFANDSATSVKVGGNVKVTLCQSDNYSGTCETFQGDDANLADNSVGSETVSSGKVESRIASCNYSADQIVLYVEPNYTGQCVTKGIGDYTNPSAIGLPNDSISSVRVGSNVKVTLCQSDNYTGTCETFQGDDANLSDNSVGNETVSAAKVDSRSSGCSINADQVAFYVDANFSGQCVIKGIGDYLNPSSMGFPNDSMSSVRVGGNVKLTLCRSDNYSDGCETFLGDDSDLSNNSIGSETVSAAKVESRTSAPGTPSLTGPYNGYLFAEGESITLSWSSTGDEYYGVITGGPSGTMTFGWQSGTSINIGSQWAGYVYTWHVKARNSVGESNPSGDWTFTVRPGTPGNLNAQAASCNQINLYWSDNSGNEEGYRIYRNGVALATVGAGVTSFSSTGLSGNTGYSYTVTAYRGSIESSTSNTVSLTTPACSTPKPDLVPAQWSGWQYPIVPSSVTNTSIVNTLFAGAPTYIDWGLTNNGTANTGGNTYGDLYIDGTLKAHYNFGDVTAYQSWGFTDWQEIITTPGWHILRVVVDPANLINESDETNNTWEHSFYWSPSTPYSDDFESDSGAWTATGLWHLVGTESAYLDYFSSVHSMWYGQESTGTYDVGAVTSGDLTSPTIYLPTGSPQYLRFWYSYQTESSLTQFDQRLIQISVDGGPFNNLAQLYDDPMFTWLRSPVYNLGSYAGHSVQIRFHFDSVDATANNYRGWFIDDVGVSSTPPPSCADTHEPNNSPQQATGISYGQTLSGDICPGSDYDYYIFTGSAGDRMVADIDAKVDDSLLDSFMFLLDSDGSTVLAQNDDEVYAQVQDSHIGFALPHSGTYYLKVRAWDNPSAGGVGYYYDLHLLVDNVAPASAIFTTPLNDAWLNPFSADFNATASDGQSGISRVEFLWHSDDWDNSDWVWLGSDSDPRDGWSWQYDTSVLPEMRGGAAYIWAFDWAGNYLGAGSWNLGIDRSIPTTTAGISQLYGDAPFLDFYSWWSGTDSWSGVARYDVQYRDGVGGSWTDLLLNTPLGSYRFLGQENHTYYFRVRAYDWAGNRSEYSSGDGDAQYTVVLCATAPDGFESDNSASVAKWITTDGTAQMHSFHVAGDQDWVQFSVLPRTVYTITTSNTGGDSDTIVDLFGPDGILRLGSNDDDPLNWPASRLGFSAVLGGLVKLKVTHWDPNAFGCTTICEVSVTQGPIGEAPVILLPLVARQ